MKIEIQKIVRPLRLSEYQPEYGDACIQVWVNPPRALRLRYWDISQEFRAAVDERLAFLKALAAKAKELAGEDKDPDELTLEELDLDDATREAMADIDRTLDELSRRLYAWFSEVWSQHEDEETHLSTDDVVALVEASADADPALWPWIQEEHWRMLNEHREGVKKK